MNFFYVDYSCENDSKTGRTMLIVPDFDTTSIRDVKHAIQDIIRAPVCDQQLFYQGQPVTDDDMLLGRLYFRQGDCFTLQFLAVADIPGMSELLDVLKISAQEIVEKLHGQLPDIEQGSASLWQFYDRLVFAVEGLATFFFPWKSLRSVAQRHFFVQEGGFDAFLEVFKFSRQLYVVGHPVDDFNINENPVERTVTAFLDQLKHHFNQGQLVLQLCCLHFLWNFGETPQDRKFVLSKDIFTLTTDALLLQPCPLEDTGHIDIASMIVGVNETAIGCCGGLVECDSNIQEKVSKMSPLIDKLLFMIDRCQSEPAGYSLFSSQVASNTLFYCSFNIKSAQPLVDCGALEKMINITRQLLVDKESNTPLRYYCCLFLARMRSAPLVTLDRDMCVAIDELIDIFLDSHVPTEISTWEEEMSFVWMTMVPLVHLAFAAGKECNFKVEMNGNNHGYQNNGLKSDALQSEEAYFLEHKHSPTTKNEVDEAGSLDMRNSQSSYPLLNSDNGEETLEKLENHFANHSTPSDISESMETEASASVDEDYLMAGTKDQFTWPGSTSVQKLGMFSLVHMLSIKENQKLALSENLLPYLVCLSWHLKGHEREKLRTSLADVHKISAPPSLKVAAKSVLALINGLDMAFNL